MKIPTLKLYLKAKEKERSTQVYQCDVLWIISDALGVKVTRYSDLVAEKKVEKGKTTEEVVATIRSVLKKDLERRLRNGGNPVRSGGETVP